MYSRGDLITSANMRLLQIAYRMGQIVGQPLGGLLSHPERNIPYFDTPFWNEYPFALPCFVSAGFAIFTLIYGALVIEEVLLSSLWMRTRLIDVGFRRPRPLFAVEKLVQSMGVFLSKMETGAHRLPGRPRPST